MGFRKNAWASVWDISTGKNGTIKARISTSYKKKDGTYKQDFSGFCILLAAAKDKANTLQPKDRIQLGNTDVSVFYDKNKKREFITYKVFDFTKSESKNRKE